MCPQTVCGPHEILGLPHGERYHSLSVFGYSLHIGFLMGRNYPFSVFGLPYLLGLSHREGVPILSLPSPALCVCSIMGEDNPVTLGPALRIESVVEICC